MTFDYEVELRRMKHESFSKSANKDNSHNFGLRNRIETQKNICKLILDCSILKVTHDL